MRMILERYAPNTYLTDHQVTLSISLTVSAKPTNTFLRLESLSWHLPQIVVVHNWVVVLWEGLQWFGKAGGLCICG